MKPSPLARRNALATCALLLASNCGTSAQTTPVGTPAPQGARGGVSSGSAATDLSEVPAPDQLIAVVRAAPPGPLAHRLGELTGMGEMIEGQLDELFHALGEAPALLADRNAPMDLEVLATGHDGDDVAFVVSMGAPAMDQIEQRLSNTHRLEPARNGLLRIESRETANRDQRAGSTPLHCAVAPTPSPTATRLVCSDNAEMLEAVAPYAARTLTRRQAPTDAVVAEVAVDQVRRHYGGQANGAIDHLRSEVDAALARDNTGPWRYGPVREALTHAMDQWLDAARGVVNDGTSLSTSLTFAQDRAVWHTEFDLRSPRSEVLRAFAAATTGQPPVPADLLAHLLPDAYFYAAGSVDERPLRSVIAPLVELGNQVLQNEHSLAPADVAALRQVLDVLPLLDQGSVSMAEGFDDHGELWAVGAMRTRELTSAQEINQMRAIVAALRRPAIAHLVEQALRAFDLPTSWLAEIRELPTTGLPAGSYAVSMPSLFAILRNSGNATVAPAPPSAGGHAGHAGRAAGRAPVARAPAGRAARVPVMQWVLVPSGPHDGLVALGPDARALLARFQVNTTPGIDARYLTAPDGAITTAIVPAGIPNSLRGTPGTNANDVAQAIARMPDQGRTPVLVRVASTQADGAVHFAMDLEVRRETIRALPLLFAPHP